MNITMHKFCMLKFNDLSWVSWFSMALFYSHGTVLQWCCYSIVTFYGSAVLMKHYFAGAIFNDTVLKGTILTSHKNSPSSQKAIEPCFQS
jgi:hypothetical protein